MDLIVSFYLFAIGLAIGSFINVIIYRSVKGESPFVGRSHCDHCGKKVDWKHNIPLLSFLFLRGKCYFCHKKISWQYPLVEFITGMLFVWWFWIGKAFFFLSTPLSFYLQPTFWLIIGIILVMIFVYDLVYGIIPDYLNKIILGLSVLYRLYLTLNGEMQWSDLKSSVAAGLLLMAFFWGLYLLTKKRGFGLGDVKLAPSLGLLLGWQKTIVGMMSAFMIGALVGIVLIAVGKKKFGQTIPFGPFLVIGTVLALVWGNQIWSWYFGLVYSY